MKKILPLIITCCIARATHAQTFYQYFDGADTSASNSVLVNIDTTGGNIWQIGPPTKNLFNAAYTVPNVIVTDTMNPYPVNDTSSFVFGYDPQTLPWGIVAIQWTQKLDLQNLADGGLVEYSVDTGATWENVWYNPYVYNFYGFPPANFDTLQSGEYGFTGTYNNWHDVWLCFSGSYFYMFDTVLFRFTLKSDSVQTSQDGWMIDNLMMHPTFVHTAKGGTQDQYFNVYPTVTAGRVDIEIEKLLEFHIIEDILLVAADGKTVKHLTNCPTKFFLDLRDLPNGMYFLTLRTNFKQETFPVFLDKH
ncbi:MAG TPA: hypothetical protein VD905_16410 [Flavobacteriales bacterium]|nr:hypothetical protein [Flavobacteriales bacterium]